MFKKLLCAASAIFLLSGSAQALVIDLTNDHCTGTCGPAGTTFGTVTLTDTADGVDFIISPLNGNLLNLSGAGMTTFSFSVTPTLTVTSFTNLTAGFLPVIPNPNQNGFGDFKYGVQDNPKQNGGFAGPLAFTVLGINFSDFIPSVNGDSNVFFAADILGTNGNTGLGWKLRSEHLLRPVSPRRRSQAHSC